MQVRPEAEDNDEPSTTYPPLSFDAFYAEHHRAVVGLAVSLSGNRWAAEELAQDAFAATFQGWDRISTYDNPGAWVRRVVANKSVSRFRRLASETRALVRLAGQRQPTLPPLTAEHDEFWREVRRLPAQQAQVVALHYLEDRSVAEVAEILGIAEGTVKSSLFRARQKLAQRLGLQIDGEQENGEQENEEDVR